MLAFCRSRPLALALAAVVGAALLMVLVLGAGDDAGLAGAAGLTPAGVKAPALRARPMRLSHGQRFVAARATRFSSTYRLADGSAVTRVSSTPLNYRDASGRWRAIDDTLVARGDGFTARADAHGVRLPRRLSGGVSVRSGRARLSMRLVGAEGEAAVRGARARYRDALPGVSVVYDAQPGGLREQLVLSDGRAPRSFVFRLRATRGLSVRLDHDGSVVLSQGHQVVFALPASVAYPPSDPSDVHAARSRLRRSAGGWSLTVTPDARWVQTALQRGPVVVDPTIEIDPDSQDCFIESDTPTTSYCSDPNLSVGFDGVNDQRGLVQFDLSALPKDAVILNADLGLTLGGHSTNTPKQVGVYPLLQPWTNSATWNNYDATHTWATAGAAGSTDASNTPAAVVTTGTTSGFVDWYPTKLVQDWVSGNVPNDGMLIRDVTPNTTANELNFSSREGGSVTPELDIVWAPRTGVLGSYTFDTQRLTDRSSLGVNVANGNLLLANDDLHVPGTGLDLDLTRYHNSMGADFGLQGVGIPGTMSLGRDVHLTTFADGSVAYYQGDGVALPFLDRTVAGGTASFTAPVDLNASLSQDTATGVYTLTFNRTGLVQTFNSSGQLTAVKDQNANTIGLTYWTSAGLGLKQITDSQGRTFSFTQVPTDGYIDTITDPTGRSWHYTYGHFDTDYLTDYQDPASKHTVYGYDTSHRLSQITTPAGNVTKITYDGSSQRVASVTRTTDMGHTTGPTTTYTYSTGSPCTSGQNKTVVTDPNGHQTTYCSDATNDRVLTVTDPVGNKRGTTYTTNGDTKDITDTPGGTGAAGVTHLIYNGDNELTGGLGPQSEALLVDYYTSTDTGGGGGPLAKFRAKSSTDDQGTSEYYAYDAHGNLTDVKDAATSPRNKATLTYNSNGTVSSVTDGSTHATSFTYDTSANPTTITPPSPLAAIHVASDSLGRVHTQQIGSGVTRTFTYDALDRVTRIDLSDGSYFTFSYDDDGSLTARSDSAGNTTSYTVDALGQRTHESFPSSHSNDYTYDAAGNLKTITDAAGTVTYNYDAADRITSIVSPTASGTSTDTVSYAYDDAGRKTTTTFPGGTVETYNYSTSGRLASINVKNSSGTVLRSLDYDYGYPSGTGTAYGSLFRSVTDQAGNKTTYTYKDSSVPEDVGRLVKARTETASHSLVEEYRYSYDKAGNRTKVEHDVPAGGGGVNTTTTTSAYDAANELCWKLVGTSSNTCSMPPAGATTFGFDGHGNETAAGAASYTYDQYDRAAGLTGTTASYLTPDNTELVGFGTTSYQNNLLGLSREIGSSTTTNYVRDPLGRPVSQRTSAGKQFFLNDAIDSTIGLADSSGSIVRSYAYDPDGNATSSGSGATTALRFAGGQVVGGVYHFATRYYDPTIGRWTQQDLIPNYTDLAMANRYDYAGANPINNTDVSGLSCTDASCGANAYPKGCLPGRCPNEKPGFIERCIDNIVRNTKPGCLYKQTRGVQRFIRRALDRHAVHGPDPDIHTPPPLEP